MAKEILIDGVDVNKCEQHSDLEYISNNNGYEEVPNSCGVYADRICENHSNCYYKQLKHKEQELQQLKVESEKLKVDYAELDKKAHEYLQENAELSNDNRKLEAENKELKGENETLKEEISAIILDCTREGCRYNDDGDYRVFYNCKAKKIFDLSANQITTKYADCLQALDEIEKFCHSTVQSGAVVVILGMIKKAKGEE